MTDVAKKRRAEEHLAGLAIEFLARGGSPRELLGYQAKEQYEILLQALDILEWHEAAGRVRAWMRRNEKKLTILSVKEVTQEGAHRRMR
jgi:hypothetical protein